MTDFGSGMSPQMILLSISVVTNIILVLYLIYINNKKGGEK